MVEKKQRQILLLAVVLALIAAGLTWSFLSSLQMQYSREAKEVSVLVARSYIPESTNLTSYMVRSTKLPLKYAQPKALTSPKDLVDEKGRSVYYTLAPIGAGEQILATKLTTPGEVTGLAPAIPKGKRAVSIAVDSVSGVADLIKPGDYVDVLATFDYSIEEKGKAIPTSETVTVLQDVLVLACGQKIVGAKEEKEKKEGGLFGGGGALGATVTLAVTPTEAEVVSFSREKGTLSLALRPTDDTEIVTVPKIGFGSILAKDTSIMRKIMREEIARAVERRSQERE